MIYLFHGTDTNRVRAKALAWIAAARAKAPDAAYLRFDARSTTREALEEATTTQGLFFSRSLVLIDDPFSEEASGEALLAALAALQSTDNPIAIVAPNLTAARLKKIESHATKLFAVDAPKKAERGFNAALVNALGARDREALWKEVTKALRQGDTPEMVHGLLHWKARDLMQKGGRGWSAEEARTLSRELITLLADSRGKDLPLTLALERWALSL